VAQKCLFQVQRSASDAAITGKNENQVTKTIFLPRTLGYLFISWNILPLVLHPCSDFRYIVRQWHRPILP